VIVNDAGLELRCKKVPDEARVAMRVQVPAAIGVIDPPPLIAHFAGVVVENEYAPSPDPPVAVAVALWLTRIEVEESEITTGEVCGASTPKNPEACAIGADSTEVANAAARAIDIRFISHQSFW
jgi:hypothetical protein